MLSGRGSLDELAGPRPIGSGQKVRNWISIAGTDRPIHEHGAPYGVGTRHGSPEAAIFAVVAVVTHAKVLVAVIEAGVILIVYALQCGVVLNIVGQRIAFMRHLERLADRIFTALIPICFLMLIVDGVLRPGWGWFVSCHFQCSGIVSH